jgi:hypothetical protein
VGHVAFAHNAVLTFFAATYAGILCQTAHPFFFGILSIFFGVHALPFSKEIFFTILWSSCTRSPTL